MRVSIGLCAGLLLLAGCAAPTARNQTADAIRREMSHAVQDSVRPSRMDEVNNALLPPLTMSLPKIGKPQETKFDLTVNDTPVGQVFMAIVSGTRYSMLLHPDVSGSISLNLKDVTVFEALEAIREVYGYEYKLDGSRIYIQPLALQTRLFQVNYLTATRAGSSSLSVQSTSGGTSSTSNPSNPSNPNNPNNPNNTGSTSSSGGTGSSNVTMTTNTRANFWLELEASLKAIVGNEPGRSVVLNLMSGVIVIRAMPNELKSVAAYLKASQISIERQVILEAKIVEVQLNDNFQSGVNWGVFKRNPNSRVVLGQVSPGGSLTTNGGAMTNGTVNLSAAGAMSVAQGLSGATGALFGLAFQTGNFAAMLDFLETQGNVHVLSSPRIATVNNQKAILKVGTDEYFITGFTSTPATTTNNVTTAGTTTATYAPMFSGIALDVTPSINENNEIILHVHPSVSQISEKNIAVASGGTVPMALTSISETDSIVRAHDGQIVVIGGLMRQATFDDQSGLPGLPKMVFGQTKKRTEKRELIILLKPTVVDSDKDWSEDITQSRDRFNGLLKSPANTQP
ncbi:MAG: secretin N-terminal domain-containing protein [Gallionella sp.]|nr:secretin N-terminal domain-containing protein [Gallionella sp.]